MTPGGPRRTARGQAMVEFALVLPLLLVIIFVILSTAMIYSVRIAEHKSAYDAARHVAKFHQGVNDKNLANGDGSAALSTAPGGDLDQAIAVFRDLDSPPSQPNWVLDTFAEPVTCQPSGRPQEIIGGPSNSIAVSLGPADSHIAVPVSDMAVEVRVCYQPVNIPGWDFLTSIYGARAGVLEERAIAVKVMDRYSPDQPQDPN